MASFYYLLIQQMGIELGTSLVPQVCRPSSGLSEEISRYCMQCFDEVTPPTTSFPTGCQQRAQLEGHRSWLKFHVFPQWATFHPHVGSSVKTWVGECSLGPGLGGGQNSPPKGKETNSPSETPSLCFQKQNKTKQNKTKQNPGETLNYHDNQLYHISIGPMRVEERASGPVWHHVGR